MTKNKYLFSHDSQHVVTEAIYSYKIFLDSGRCDFTMMCSFLKTPFFIAEIRNCCRDVF